MDFTGTLAISGSALSAERLRLDAIASNLANASTTRTPEGGPYRRRNVVFAADPVENDFGETLASLTEQGAREGVVVTDVVEDHTPPRMVFDPSHPDANADGYVAYPNVDPMTETIDLMAATRAYEANVQVVNATRRMAEAALGIGG
ncbi:MAG: flagellar basal body rod protein FlgC [Deltaproteobacteria bacterium]|nr:MAG: flagellar basal body rod protein FlgC [Deltaproteobacteria bacterium]TMA94154.1 MAG: flagellar basal body rod protein FlgC [Deltaproteobacteria bacterium]